MQDIPESNGPDRSVAADQTSDSPSLEKSKRARKLRARPKEHERTGSKREPIINFIRSTQTPVQSGPASRVGSRASAQTAERDDGRNAVRRPLDQESVPDAVRQRYVRDGRKYFHPNGDKAFTDHGAKLTTKSENTTIVRDFIAIAKARGWSEIAIGGTSAFKKEVWREAKLAGLEVKGYRPTRVEQALLIRAMSSASRPQPGHQTHEREAKLEREEAARPAEERRRAKRAAREEGLLTGVLLEHGKAPHQHDPEQDPSYFVRLRINRGGEREIWGVDLERAIRQSLTAVQIGDRVGLRAVSREDFTLTKQQPDEHGRLKPAQVDAHRNRWVIEQRRFFDDRAILAEVFRDTALKPKDVIRKHPELKGSYLKLQAAKLHIEQSNPNTEDRVKLLSGVREAMAASMERGESLTPVRMQQRAANRTLAEMDKTPDPQTLVR